MDIIHSKFLRDDVDGVRLNPLEMKLLQTGTNNRNRRGFFDGGELQDLLRFIDEKREFAYKGTRGKTSYRQEDFMERFIDPIFKKPSVFNKFLATANHLDGFPECIVELRHHFHTANATTLLEWKINSIQGAHIWRMSQPELKYMFQLLHSGALKTHADVKDHTKTVLNRHELTVS